MQKILTNTEIFDIAEWYEAYFKLDNDIYIPAKLNFSIHKNFKQILKARKEIEEARNNVIKHYGVVSFDGKYTIDDENLPRAQKELDELALTEQTFELLPITLDDLSKIKLTSAQYAALEFMLNINDVPEVDTETAGMRVTLE